MSHAPLIALRHHQDRDRVAERLRNAAIGILRARAVLHAEHAELAPRRHARNGVRHMQANALLAHHDGTNIDRRRELDEMIDRISGENLDAFALEDRRDRCPYFHVYSIS
jgi:hypothetical protein